MNSLTITPDDRVLVIGATGFVGSRLAAELLKKGIKPRLLVRNPSKLAPSLLENKLIEIVKGDLLNNEGLSDALHNIHTTYYLVHSIGGSNSVFARRGRSGGTLKISGGVFCRPLDFFVIRFFLI